MLSSFKPPLTKHRAKVFLPAIPSGRTSIDFCQKDDFQLCSSSKIPDLQQEVAAEDDAAAVGLQEEREGGEVEGVEEAVREGRVGTEEVVHVDQEDAGLAGESAAGILKRSTGKVSIQ